MKIKMLKLTVPFLAAFGFFIGCSDVNRSNEDNSSVSSTELSTANDEMTLLKTSGVVALDPASGVFSLDWRKVFHPNEQTTDLVGNAMGVAFGSEQEIFPGIKKSGIDIGSIFLNYNGTQLEIPKQTTPDGGFVYTFMNRPMGGKGKGHGGPPPTQMSAPVSIPFVSGGSYEFEITGSDAFAGIKLQVTAPTSLIDITNYADADSVDQTSDLTINWAGGLSTDSVLIKVAILPEMPADNNPGGKGGHGKHGGNDGNGEPGMKEGHPDFLKLVESNTGSYTLTAATIADILAATSGSKIAISVGQVSSVDTEHATGTLKTLLRNEDSVVLNLK